MSVTELKIIDSQFIPQCYHCGENCTDTIVNYAGKQFCCDGCKTVYELLNENELCEYYDITLKPGNRVKSKKPGLRFAFLDLQETKNELLLFADGKLEKIKFYIPSIHCNSCIWLLENLHRLHQGILYSNINFLRKEATVSYNKTEISLREVAELLYSIGYGPDITLDSLQEKKPNKSRNNISLKLGIAGFSFGNIMLLSFPEYFSSGTYFGMSQTWFFAYLNILLALPVFFYSSLDYFISAYGGLKARIINIDLPVSIGIIVLFARSLYDIISGTGAGFLDSMTGLVFFLLIGKWFQQKTYDALSFEKDYKAYFPVAITRIENQKETIVPLNKIKKGDILLIRNNEIIPCDSRLINATASIDYSFVTGESLPVNKKKGNTLFAGGKAINDSFQVVAIKEVSQSYLVELWKQEAFNKNKPKDTASLIDNVSKYFTGSILLIALLAGIYWWIHDPSKTWNVITAVLIVACPCALALSIPFTFGNVVRIFGRKGLFMKNSEALESMSHANTVVFDKTGTITENESLKLIFNGNDLTADDKKAIFSVCKKSFHPLSMAISREMHGSGQVEVTDFQEVTGKGIQGIANGKKYAIGSKKWVGMEGAAIADANVYLTVDGELIGTFNIENQYRNNLASIFKNLSSNYKLAILSGDNNRELNRLKSIVPNGADILFKQSPYDKLAFIKKQQDNYQKVIMIGDGLNDAGALKQSDFGISIAENVHHFSPSCDAILKAESFSELPGFFNFSKTAMKVVKASIVISFLYNIVGITLAVKGLLSPLVAAILMPLSSITVVVFITLSTNLLAAKKGLTTKTLRI